MILILNVLSAALAFAQLACWIIVMIKIFKNKHILVGVLSVFCGLLTFMYGWIKVSELDAKKVMTIWTLLLLLHMLLIAVMVMMGFAGGAMVEGGLAPEML